MALFQRKVVGIKGCDLTAVISRFIGILIVHIIGNSYFRKQTRMNPHLVRAFFSNSSQLVGKAVTNCAFSDLDCKCWG